MIKDRFSTCLAVAAIGVSLVAASAYADSHGGMKGSEAIKARKALMKTMGFSAKSAAAMIKGQAPYDPVKAELAMRAMNAVAIGVVQFFPPDSKTGGETEASPKIWEDMKGFLHEAHELAEHSSKGAAAAKKGLDAFKAEFVATTKYCKACHKGYRIKKEK